MLLRDADAADLPAVADFFERLGVAFPDANLEQFVRPSHGAWAVGSRLVLGEDGGLQGLLGYLDRPLRLGGTACSSRWPVNFFLAPELRGRGLGKELMAGVMAQADLGLVLGGNRYSIPVLERTGWRRLGHLKTYSWAGAPPSGCGLGSAAVVAGLPPATPWVEARPSCCGVPRTVDLPAKAFGGALRPLHRVFHRLDGDAVTGFFVLSARSGETRPGETRPKVTLVDFESVPGREAELVAAALDTASTFGGEIEAHACRDDMCAAFEATRPRRAATGLPVWILDPEQRVDVTGGLGPWHVTFGDHDRYRQWPDSVTLCASSDELTRPSPF